ncbi:MAG: hypothetical protein WBB57_09520 [Mycobacterium sp.]
MAAANGVRRSWLTADSSERRSSSAREEPATPVLDHLRRHHLDAIDEFGGLASAVGFDDRRDHIGAAFAPAVRLAEHRVRLADAGCRAEVDAQFTPLGAVVGRAHLFIIHRRVPG